MVIWNGYKTMYIYMYLGVCFFSARTAGQSCQSQAFVKEL